MFRYSVYGLTLSASVRLEEFVETSAAEVDIEVCVGDLPGWLDEPVVAERFRVRDDEREDRLVVTERASGFSFRYGDGTAFDLSREMNRIWCRFEAPLVLADAVVYLAGPILGFALRMRGVLCLHASAIALDGVAVALAGPPGAGKSTAAAAFAAAGYPVLSDDLTALVPLRGDWMAQPAFPHVRLWRESEHALFGTNGALPRITPSWDKRALRLGSDGFAFQSSPAPLGAIVFLAEPSKEPVAAPELTPMSPRDAVLAISGETYANYLLDGEARRQEFHVITELVGTVPVWEVRGTRDETPPDAIVSAVVAHLRTR
jgi:hypothetical protein